MGIKNRFLFLGLIVFSIGSVVFAEKIDLVGVVKNKSGAAVEGAKLKLFGNEDVVAVTDSDGKFHLSGDISSVERKSAFSSKKQITFRGSRVMLNLEKLSSVNISIFNIDGKVVNEFNCGELRAGLNVIPLPVKQLSSGMYMVVVSVNSSRYIFRCVSSSGKVAMQEFANVNSTEKGSLQKTAASKVVIDSILVTADGYENTSYPIETYSQSNIVITLAGGSRLDNITKKCVDCMPTPISGGQSGWGSRYWDCCKPHCSWPENTTSLCANCSMDGATEIECYREAGNEWSKWLEGTKNSCDGGEAFTCYRHVPFAVCENLAYGYAAVPGTDAACGKCFQLEFDGGARHGEPKRAHEMMKGKVMIVMASNIGHDVSGGQFDIMIPGGGMGNFVQGCARQWNVDLNDRALIGENLGGFISYCQKKPELGWDADPEDLKACVSGMCDNLFGKDPALHDLWEGCMWYVNWMHAVDNPTFKYKEVPCPKDLTELYFSSKHPRP